MQTLCSFQCTDYTSDPQREQRDRRSGCRRQVYRRTDGIRCATVGPPKFEHNFKVILTTLRFDLDLMFDIIRVSCQSPVCIARLFG
jgi:hypothetical protein